MSNNYAIGLDIGGTKIAATIMDEHQNIYNRHEVPSITTDAESMYDQVVICVEQLLKDTTINRSEINGIGVGVPGKVDRGKGIAVFQNNLPWGNFPLAKRLKESFEIENIVIDNDVYMATLAEWKAYRSSIEETFVFITISTGISCSIIHHGDFIRGDGFAGEIGLLPVKSILHPDKLNRFERVAAGPAIEKWAKEKGWLTKEVLDYYQKDDPFANKVMNSVIDSIAHGLFAIICTINPHRVVFGGGVMNNHPYLIEKIKVQLEDYLVEEQRSILKSMYMSQHKGDAGIIGAGLSVF